MNEDSRSTDTNDMIGSFGSPTNNLNNSYNKLSSIMSSRRQSINKLEAQNKKKRRSSISMLNEMMTEIKESKMKMVKKLVNQVSQVNQKLIRVIKVKYQMNQVLLKIIQNQVLLILILILH